MKKIAVGLLITLAAGSAMATTSKPTNEATASAGASSNSTSVGVGIGVGSAKVDSNNTNTNSVKNDVRSNNVNTNVANGGKGGEGGVGIGGNQAQQQGQVQGQVAKGGNATGGNSTATGGNAQGGSSDASASSGGNSQSVNISNPSDLTVKSVGQAPDVAVFPTANCRVALGGSVGFLGGAFGFGGSVVDETCETIEVSKQLIQLGERAAAVQAMCLIDKARSALEATGVKCHVGNKVAVVQEVVKP